MDLLANGPMGFNPLPPPKRGETLCFPGLCSPYQFQSTPPAEARGDDPVQRSSVAG